VKEERVRGLRLRFASSAVNHRALQLFGSRLPRLGGAGWMPWLQLARFDARALPGPDWLRVRPVLAGICGTDLALLTGRASAVMSPFTSFPAVLGHEVVGTVVEVGASVEAAAVGDRVVVDPVISCRVRGLDPCRECGDGHPATCLRATDGPISPGLLIGFCRDLPGAWGDEMLVHASQVHLVPPEVPDAVAVLVEPLSVALHAVLRAPPAGGSQVLVIGGGSMGLLVTAALRLLAPDAEVTVLTRHPLQARMAGRMGADRVVREGESGVMSVAGARGFRSLHGTTVYAGGFPFVYDCVGSRETLDLSLRVASPRGHVVVVGGPGVIGDLDWTLLWTRERTMIGSYVYAEEPSLDGRPHTFDVALGLLRDHHLPLGELVTHRFRLERWREAMAVNLKRGRVGVLKAVFEISGS
jgi:L-iditol 2-dehydrogenase